MNDPRRGELHAYVASRFAAEDEARSKWLDERIPEFLRLNARRDVCRHCGAERKRRPSTGKPWCPECRKAKGYSP